MIKCFSIFLFFNFIFYFLQKKVLYNPNFVKLFLLKVYGDWGLGIWGLVIGDWAQSPIPNPQSPIPNPQSPSEQCH
jgi:hypothetical protein